MVPSQQTSEVRKMQLPDPARCLISLSRPAA
jgi:hypothetical protein